MSNIDPGERSCRLTHDGARWAGWAAVTLGVIIPAACQRDARLADAKLRDPVVKDVTVAGLTLDQKATPQEVTFTLLQAIKADIEAGRDLAAREKAFDDQFALAAPKAIHVQHIRAVGPEHAELKESVYKTVRTWAPTLGHYVKSFDFPVEEISTRMQAKSDSLTINRVAIPERRVLLEAQDPDGDPNAAVVVAVRLVQEEGRWRVWWVGFEHSIRHLPTADRTPGEPMAPQPG